MQTGSDDPLALQGVIPPTITVFDEHEEVDYEQTAAHAQYVVDGGAHGVFPLGTNGEFPLLTGEERKGVIEAVVEGIDDVPVIAGIGAPSTYETVEHAEHAESVGADGLVVVTPYYYPLDHDAALVHYQRVAASVNLPIYIYHIPSKTGNELSLATLEALSEIENLAGVKDSSKDVPWLAQGIDAHPELTFLAGSDSLLFPGLEIGCSGMVSAVANVFPELVVDLFESYDAGDEERARELQSDVYDVRDAIKYGSYMAGVKSALPHVGFEAGPLRSPLRTMEPEAEERMVADLDALGLL